MASKFMVRDSVTGLLNRVNGSASAVLITDNTNSVNYVAINAGSLLGHSVSGASPTQLTSNTILEIIGQPQTLTVGATITYNVNFGPYCKVTLNQAGHTLNFTNTVPSGMSGRIAVYQDGTGSRTITTYQLEGVSTNVKFPSTAAVPVLSTGANTMDVLEWWYTGTQLLVWRAS
jgi:hypothetical protein